MSMMVPCTQSWLEYKGFPLAVCIKTFFATCIKYFIFFIHCGVARTCREGVLQPTSKLPHPTTSHIPREMFPHWSQRHSCRTNQGWTSHVIAYECSPLWWRSSLLLGTGWSQGASGLLMVRHTVSCTLWDDRLPKAASKSLKTLPQSTLQQLQSEEKPHKMTADGVRFQLSHL